MYFTQESNLKIDIKYYIKGMLKELPYKMKATQKTPWTEKFPKTQEDANNLNKERYSIFHIYAMKEIFLCKRERLDIDQ